MDDSTSKTCSSCRHALPTSAFGRSARAKDGLRSQCLECNQARARKAYTHAGPPKTITCAHCGASAQMRNPRAIYCGDMCKHRAAEDRRSAKAALHPGRQCQRCGVKVETIAGAPVCPDCHVDRRDASKRDRRRTLRKYGLTEADWDAMLAAQEGRCAICRTDTPGGRGERWHIDHDHATGVVRGLLCHQCNVGIGNLRDDPAIMLAAIAYLTRTA